MYENEVKQAYRSIPLQKKSQKHTSELKAFSKSFAFTPFAVAHPSEELEEASTMLLVQIRKDSIHEDLNAPFSTLMLAIKPFALEVPVNKAYKGLDIV